MDQILSSIRQTLEQLSLSYFPAMCRQSMGDHFLMRNHDNSSTTLPKLLTHLQDRKRIYRILPEGGFIKEQNRFLKYNSACYA
ncbi:hypothetical protein D3C73_1266620 [compost metagenome]